MNPSLIIAVIGGTGKSGSYLVKQLLNQGYQLKLLLRNPDKLQIKSPKIEIITGDINDYTTIYQLIKGCDAVISTLGLGIPASEPTIFSQSSSNVLKAMNELAVRRYIVTTGLNVDTPFDKKTGTTAFGTDWMKKTFPLSTANKQLEYDILKASSIDWTLVRLPLIELTDEVGEVTASLEDCPGEKISATDLADFLIEQLTDRRFIQKAPFVASKI
ncbi:epimerase [Solitalea longa]|uniref:Epimerase n=1 Tax=Solitalea longa TaxID=2079460 RepID=A0A2S5AA99_9SPHI|nr:NAD(P)H-binding protein [Solitalea longa]POY39043.1 epimerase [Solitalea longa]